MSDISSIKHYFKKRGIILIVNPSAEQMISKDKSYIEKQYDDQLKLVNHLRINVPYQKDRIERAAKNLHDIDTAKHLYDCVIMISDIKSFFKKYEEVRLSGKYNMLMDADKAMYAMKMNPQQKLNKEIYFGLIENYDKCAEMWLKRFS